VNGLLRAPLGTSIPRPRTMDKTVPRNGVLRCLLCHEAPTTGMHPVPVVSRTTPLFVLCELWCEGCATLAYGVHLFRHATLPKGEG